MAEIIRIPRSVWRARGHKIYHGRCECCGAPVITIVTDNGGYDGTQHNADCNPSACHAQQG